MGLAGHARGGLALIPLLVCLASPASATEAPPRSRASSSSPRSVPTRPRAREAPRSPAGDEVIEDPEDAPHRPSRRAGMSSPRSQPSPRSPAGDEVIEDPEDAPHRPARRSGGSPGTRPRARAAPPPSTPAFTPRVLVGGWLGVLTAFDVRFEGRRRGVAGDDRPTEDIFELWSRGQLHLETRFRRWAKARVEARLEHVARCERPSEGDFFWLGNGKAWESHAEVTLREAYVDLYLGPVDLRLGQQVVSWGLSELVNPNDVVNPLDLRRGALGFDEDLRIPVLAVRAAYHWRWLKVEGVWQPFFVPHRVDLWGSDFALLGPGSSGALAEAERALDGAVDPTVRSSLQPLLLSTRRPRDDLSGSSAGVRLSASRAGWDLGLQYWFGWDRTPAVSVDPAFYQAAMDGELLLNGTVNVTALGALLTGAPLFRAEYRRGHRVGISVGKSLSSLAFRLDVSYAPNQGYLRLDRVGSPLPSSLVSLRVEHHSLVSALSAEYAWGQRVLVQVEGVHAALLDKARSDTRQLWGFGRGAHVGLVVALVRLQFLAERLQVLAGAVVDVVQGSFALAPAVTYRVTDAWRIGVGALAFEGGDKTLFGAWTRNDLIWLDARWSF